jgi:hypothetical protein
MERMQSVVRILSMPMLGLGLVALMVVAGCGFIESDEETAEKPVPVGDATAGEATQEGQVGGGSSFKAGSFETQLGEVTLTRKGAVLVNGDEAGHYEVTDGKVTISILGRSDTYTISEAGNLLHEASGITTEFKRIR